MNQEGVLESQVREKLRLVLDPELGVSIVDLGLIYQIAVDKAGVCHILMTLTTIGCPLFGQIKSEVEARVKELGAIQAVTIELTFDPPWTPEKMSLEAKVQLGIE